MKMRSFGRRKAGSRSPLGLALPMAAVAGVLLTLLSPATALANDDPHRTFLAAAPFDLPVGVCSFPVHLTFPVNNEYGTFSTAADGSTVIKVTGAVVVTATNKLTGATLTLDASGPAMLTFSPDGTTEQLDGRGLGLFFAANGPQFGLPSNLVYTSGPLDATIALATNSLTSLNNPHVLLDVCAALA